MIEAKMTLRCFSSGATARFLPLVVHPIGVKRFLAKARTVSLPAGSKGNNTRLRLFLGPQALTFTVGLPFAAAVRRWLWGGCFRRRAYAASCAWVRRHAVASADGHPLGPGV